MPRSGFRRTQRPSGIVRYRKFLAFLSIALLGAGALLLSKGQGTQKPANQQPTNPEQILLLSSDRPGPGTFTSSVAQASVTSPLPRSVPSTSAGAPRQFSGSSEGLYAATRGEPGCDARQLGMFLKASPDNARSWAAASRIAAADISPYLEALTPALTRADTRVTDYGLVQGRPVGRQAVMQAGTAVLLDRAGVPRVRCLSGNPLGVPGTVPSTVGYTGSRWPGFRPDATIVVAPAREPLPAIIVFDLATGQPFARIPGSFALVDIDKPQPGTALKILEPGQPSTVSGNLWPRSRPVTISFDNPNVTLGSANADDAGTFTVEVTVPRDTVPGIHRVSIAGAGLRVDQTVYVIPRSVRVGPS